MESTYIRTGDLEIGTDDLPLAQKESSPGNGNGLHANPFSIPAADSFDLTALLEGAE